MSMYIIQYGFNNTDDTWIGGIYTSLERAEKAARSIVSNPTKMHSRNHGPLEFLSVTEIKENSIHWNGKTVLWWDQAGFNG